MSEDGTRREPGRPGQGGLQAVILDLDGVITRTAAVHARAWKETFDTFLRERGPREGERHDPFDIETDYLRYVDGKPRYDGVRSFLASRGIELPEGEPEDGGERPTVHGLGNAKNQRFRRLLDEAGVEVFDDAREQIARWRERGLETAVVSSSRNCAAVLEAAGLTEWFDARVDGVEAERLGLSGKPAPDLFLEAARRLGVEPRAAAVLEDAIAGVEAGRAGGFGWVVGVRRTGEPGALRQAGADRVVRRLTELDLDAGSGPGDPEEAMPRAFAGHRAEFARHLRGRPVALFLDYDGTLTPIVERPELATLSDGMRSTLRRAARRLRALAVVSGRDLDDVRRLVGLGEVVYAGSHGFDIAGPHGLRRQQEEARERLGDLDDAEAALRDRLRSLRGVHVERKRFAIAIHYRQASRGDVPEIERVVDDVGRRHPRLRKRGGKEIFELQPDIEWDKGRAVLWLLETLGLDGTDAVPVYVGDDETDEDAFRSLEGLGLGVRVGEAGDATRASWRLEDPEEVRELLELLLTLGSEEADRG